MRPLVVVLMVFLVACKPPSLRLSHELDRSASWLAAVAEIGRTTASNRTPARYADDAVRDAMDEVNKASAAMQDIHLAPDITAVANRLMTEAAPRMARLRDDLLAAHADLHGGADWLEAASDTLSDLGKRARQLDR
jgi:hypothetical protein